MQAPLIIVPLVNPVGSPEQLLATLNVIAACDLRSIVVATGGLPAGHVEAARSATDTELLFTTASTSTPMPNQVTMYRTARGWLRDEQADLVHTLDDQAAVSWGPAARRNRIPHLWQCSSEMAVPGDTARLWSASYVLASSRVLAQRFGERKRLPPAAAVEGTPSHSVVAAAYAALLPPFGSLKEHV